VKRQIFKSKIHRATVTGANVNYEGSITIDPVLMNAADIVPYEAVHVWNITNGTRLITYAIDGEKDSGEICVNGAGAKLCKIGDLIIIATFAEMTSKKARRWNPIVVKVNNKNLASLKCEGLVIPVILNGNQNHIQRNIWDDDEDDEDDEE